MFRSIIVVLAIVSVAYATKVQNCSGKPETKGVRIKGCDQPPCKVVKGTSGEFEVDFTLSRVATSLNTKVLATALGVTIPYDLPENVANVCKNLANGAFCPLEQGEDATYLFKLPILKYYPEIKVRVEVSILDQNQTPVTCFAVDIQVVKSL